MAFPGLSSTALYQSDSDHGAGGVVKGRREVTSVSPGATSPVVTISADNV